MTISFISVVPSPHVYSARRMNNASNGFQVSQHRSLPSHRDIERQNNVSNGGLHKRSELSFSQPLSFLPTFHVNSRRQNSITNGLRAMSQHQSQHSLSQGLSSQSSLNETMAADYQRGDTKYGGEQKLGIPFHIVATLLIWFLYQKFVRKTRDREQKMESLATKPCNVTVNWYEQKEIKWAWYSVDYPLICFGTFLILSGFAEYLAPTITAEHIACSRKAALVVGSGWVLYRLKNKLFDVIVTGKGKFQDYMTVLEKLLTAGIVLLVILTSIEQCRFDVKTIISVGGAIVGAVAAIGGSLIDNFLSGISIKLFKSFGVKQIIKVGDIQGEVTEIGFFQTKVLTVKNILICVPNAYFSKKEIMYDMDYHMEVHTIPLKTKDIRKMKKISSDVKEMLRSNALVELKKELPSCSLSRVLGSDCELTVTYNIKNMAIEQLSDSNAEILYNITEIICKNGIDLVCD